MKRTQTSVANLFNPYPANVDNMASSYASKWRMGFNSAFKGLTEQVLFDRGAGIAQSV